MSIHQCMSTRGVEKRDFPWAPKYNCSVSWVSKWASLGELVVLGWASLRGAHLFGSVFGMADMFGAPWMIRR